MFECCSLWLLLFASVVDVVVVVVLQFIYKLYNSTQDVTLNQTIK